MDHKVFQKARLAAALALVSGTTLLTGCLVEGDDSNTTSTTVQEDASRISVTEQNTPLAQILGIVQDTNGNPVAGARVSIGSTSVVTDANGAYSLNDIPVSGIAGSGSMQPATPVEISIVPVSSDSGKNYLSATVSVTPSASTIIQTVDGDSSNTEDALLAIITTDGLAVSAGITVVPLLQSTVTGILRDYDTGLPVVNAVVGLEVLGVKGVVQQQEQNNGNGTSYGVGTYQAATDAEGRFEYTNLPVDTDFAISVADWLVDGLGGGDEGDTSISGAHFATTPEVVMQNIGTVYAEEITSQDDVNPFVVSVSGVVVNSDPGLLNDDLDGSQGLVINFSEPLQQLVDANSVYVYNETLESRINVSSAALSADGMSLTLTTSAISAGNVFSVYLNTMDFQDTSENPLIYRAATPDFKGTATPAYDSNSSVGAMNSVRLRLKTYADPITETGAVVGLTQLLSDGNNSAFGVLQTLNLTFLDLDSGTLRSGDTYIEQLNAEEAGNRLTNLSDTTYADASISGKPTMVDTTAARVRFTIDSSTPSRNYQLSLTNPSGTAKEFTVTVASTIGTVDYSDADHPVLQLADYFSGTVDLILKGSGGDILTPNDTLTIASLTDFGVADSVASLVLTDQIAPTTVLQNSYGQGEKTDAVVTDYYGDGGELAEAGESAMGAPFLNVTPRLLVPQAGEGVPLPVASTWKALTDEADKDSSDNPQVSDSNLTGYALYDANAWNEWSANGDRERRIGVAFSEDISVSGTPAYNGTVLLSGWTAQNNVIQNDQGVTVSADLVSITVADVMALANTDHGSVVDFSGAVTDASGNTSTAVNNAKVVVRDLMPPMLTNAVYNGDNIVLTFNENVVLNDGDEFVLAGSAAAPLPIAANTANTTVTGNTVTIDRAAWGSDLNSEIYFDRGTYDHDGNPATDDVAHGALIAAATEDSRGVSWSDWDGGAGLVDIPAIVIRDAVGNFQVNSTQTTGFAAGSTTFIVVYRFSHRIDLTTSFGSANSTSMDGAAVAANFTLGGALSNADINTTNTSAALDTSGRVLTVTVAVNTALSAGDEFGLTGGSITSEWDSDDPVISTLTNVTVQ